MCECGSDRIASISAKCSDCCCVSYKETNYNGYVPGGIGVGGGDYLEIDYCLDCGRIQSDKFPIDDEKIKYAMTTDQQKEMW